MAVAMMLFASPVHADPQPWREVWAGSDVAAHVWLVYAGATIAPHGGIFEDGLRLRASAGYGGYRYSGERRGQIVSFRAQTAYVEAMAGYLWRLGPLTAKVFAGVADIEHHVAPLDPENLVQGGEFGPKVGSELWLNMGQSAWGSLDAFWTTAHQTAALRTRVGYRAFGDLSLGIEGALNANDLGEDIRGGLFARAAWNGGELSVSAGFSGRYLDASTSLRDPYTTFNWLTQF